MKKFLLLIFGAVTLLAHSQNTTFTKGDECTGNGAFKGVIGENKNAFYVLRAKEKVMAIDCFIEKYNKESFKLEWSTKTDSRYIYYPNSKIRIEKDKISLYYVAYDKPSSAYNVNQLTFDDQTGEPMPVQTLYMEKSVTDQLVLGFSNDSSMLIIQYCPINMSGNGMPCKKVRVLDLQSGKEVFTKELPVSDGSNPLECRSIQIDNLGNLSCQFGRIIKKTSSSPEQFIEGVGKIPVKATKMSAADIDFTLGDHIDITATRMATQPNLEYIVYAGTFINKKSKVKGQNAGNFFIKVDLNKSKEISRTITYFDEKTSKLYDELDEIGTSDQKLYSLRTIIDDKTDDVYTISYGLTKSIFVTKFDKEGKVIWTQVVPRSADVQRPAFAYAVKGKQFFFVLLDNKKNMEKIDPNNFSFKDVKGYSASTGQNVMCFKINERGEMSRTLLSVNDFATTNFIPPVPSESELVINTDAIQDLSNAPVYLYTNMKKEQFVRFKFE